MGEVLAFSSDPSHLGPSSPVILLSDLYVPTLQTCPSHVCFLLDELAHLLGKTEGIHINVMGKQNDICIFKKIEALICNIFIGAGKDVLQAERWVAGLIRGS